MKKFKSIIAFALAGMMLFTTACSTTTDKSNESKIDAATKVARLNGMTDPKTLHPGLVSSMNESWLVEQMFKGLYKKTPDGDLELAVAETVTTSEDGLTWTFTIRDSHWSSGNKVVAEDFVEAMLYTLNPENAASFSYALYILENGEEYNKGEVSAKEVGVKAIDNKTFEMKLKTPIPYLPDLLTNTFFFPIDSVNAKEHPDWYMSPDNYSTNGVFVLDVWAPKERVAMVKNENYYDVSRTKLDGITFDIIEDRTTEWQMYQSGQLDLLYSPLTDMVEQLIAEGNPEITVSEELTSNYHIFNTQKKPFNNAKVRNALSMAINREEIVKNVTKAGQKPSYTLTAMGIDDPEGNDFAESLGHIYEEDIATARALLEEGLVEEGMTTDGFKFTLLYNTDDTNKKVAEVMQNMWSQNLGITVDLESNEFQTMAARSSEGDFDVVRGGWVGDYLDPMTFDEIFTSYSEYNYAKWINDDYDELIQKALYEPNEATRMNYLRDAETLLIKDMPIIPLYYSSKVIVQKPYLEGVYCSVNKYPNMEYADIIQ